MCKTCLNAEVLLMNEWTPEELKGIELKEHTQRFKDAVEKCKNDLHKSQKSWSQDKIASYCFAAITKVFKQHSLPIFAEAGTEVEIGQGMKVQFTSAFDPIEQAVKLPMDVKTLYTLLTEKLKKELHECLSKEFECPNCGDNK